MSYAYMCACVWLTLPLLSPTRRPRALLGGTEGGGLGSAGGAVLAESFSSGGSGGAPCLWERWLCLICFVNGCVAVK